jgi:hypothetical protein
MPIRNHRTDTPPALEAVVRRALRRHADSRSPNLRAPLRELDHLEQVERSTYHMTPEPPMAGTIAGAEGRAIARPVAGVAGGMHRRRHPRHRPQPHPAMNTSGER